MADLMIWDMAEKRTRALTTADLAAMGGGGGGSATLAEQQAQTTLQTTIANACDVPLSDVVAAVEALGATATIADVVTLLISDAATQADILAKLGDLDVDTTAMVSSLSAIESDADATRIAAQETAADLSQLATGFISVRISDGTSFPTLLTNGGTVVLGTSTAWAGKFQIGDGTNTATTLTGQGVGNERGLAVHVVSQPSVSIAGVATATNQTSGGQKTQITDGANSASVTNAAPTTEYGIVVRNIPSGTQNVAASATAQTAAGFFAARLTTDGTNFVGGGAVGTGITIPSYGVDARSWLMAVFSGSGYRVQCDSTGNLRMVGVNATGSAPTNENPVYVAVLDVNGVKRSPAVNTSGHMIVREHDGVGDVGANRGLPIRQDRASRDAYNRARTVHPHQVMGAQFMYSTNPLDVGTELVTGGTATWSSTDQALVLSCTGTSGSLARMASHRSTKANPGMSGGPAIHFKFGTSNANNRYDVMITDTAIQYGFGVREQGGTIYIVIYHPGAGGEVLIPSSAWNINTATAIGLTNLNTTFHCVEGQGSGDGGFFTRISINGEPIHFFGPLPSALFNPNTAWRIQARATNTGTGVAGTCSVKSYVFVTDSGNDNDALYPDFYTLAADKTATTTEAVLFAIRPLLTVSGKDNPLSLFPKLVIPVFDTGNVEVRAYYQQGGTDPLGGTGTWLPSTTGPWEINATATSFTSNANTRLCGFTGTTRGGEEIDFSGTFGDGAKLALRSRFNDAARELLIITVKTRSGSHPANALLEFDHQSNI